MGTKPLLSEGVGSPWGRKREKPGGEGMAYRLSEGTFTNLSSPPEDGASARTLGERFGPLGPVLLRVLIFTWVTPGL